jgi:uncharacterized phiE125 gp8 family phage protein
VALYAYALTTLASALAALGRDKAKEPDSEALLTNCINWATAEMERETNRRLAARSYATTTRLVADGREDRCVWVPEYPVNSVTDISAVDDDGAETALSLTGKRIEAETGKVYLPNAAIPVGDGNLLVTCNAGYAAGVVELYDLERICLRLTSVIFQDFKTQPGRVLDATLMNASRRIPDFELPADIRSALVAYRRLW